MEVVKIAPRGYCHGVVNALNIVKEVRKKHPNETVSVLGIIIHNKFIKEALDRLNIITVHNPNKSRMELLDEVNEGIIIFSAHGISEQIVNKAKDKGLIVYNAVCKDVVKTQDIVKEYLNKDYKVLYIGKENHPEAEAILAIDESIKLISKMSDLDNLKIDDKTIITNQTTMSVYDTKELVDKMLQINPNIEVINEICRATEMRQSALFDRSDLDMLYVVGDHLSNNCNNLAKVARNSVSKVKLIESVIDIDHDDLVGISKIGVTSGASTPTSITNQVIEYLEKYPNVSESDRIIDYEKLL